MDEEIVIDRGHTTVMKLDADEQALMDEIEISAPRPQPVPRPAPYRPQRPVHQEQETMDAFVNPNKQTAPRQPMQEEEIDYGEEEPAFYDDEPQMGEGPSGEQPSKGYTSVDEEKSDLINKLALLEKKGFSVNKRLNAYSNVEELRAEVKRITYSIDVEQSVRFSRRMLVACVTGLEFLNKR